ncbi:MAG TPA: hypothetical protein VMV55_03740 [Methanoregula sp.]|nr:hypothetical protein [Methanoregula sp.]
MNVILKCPVCPDSRVVIPFEEYCKSILPLSNKRIRCKECGAFMLYHKDVPEE